MGHGLIGVPEERVAWLLLGRIVLMLVFPHRSVALVSIRAGILIVHAWEVLGNRILAGIYLHC